MKNIIIATICLILLIFIINQFKVRYGTMWGNSLDEDRAERIKKYEESYAPKRWFAWRPVRLYKTEKNGNGGRWVWGIYVIKTDVMPGFTTTYHLESLD